MPANSPESPAPLAEISHGPSAFERFLDNNQKNLVILTVLLVIGAAALVVYRGIETSRQESAGAALNKAADLKALQSVTQEHQDTRAATSAAVLLAESQWNEGQQDAAIATLRTVVDSKTEHPALPTARASLAAKLMAQGKTADATAVFQQILDDPKARFIAPYAHLSLGDIAKVAGDLDKAELSYTRVKNDFPDSSFADTANRRISSLKTLPPVEVEAPPAPAPAAGPAAQPAPPPAPMAPSIHKPAVEETPAPPVTQQSPAPPPSDTVPPEPSPANPEP